MASKVGEGRDNGKMPPSHQPSVRHVIALSERKFNVKTLPADMLRVYRALESKFGEEYALLFVFNMRTAIELHRAWHMTLLTSKILQSVKDRFGLRMTWNLGVIRLKFRVEDGGFELHRKVPYDYDSEFQDLYMRIATALIQDRITVHEALIFQTDVKEGRHTARSGLFLRDFPGRLVVYPALAATCAVIFFGGDWVDAGVAAICGVATGLFEYALVTIGGEAKILIDLFAGMITGIIGALFYRFNGETYCLSAIFLGTLYWYFYGTAFVIGILEIITGELETGVTRFMAVSIKTFVLCLSASFGMLLTLEAPADVWKDQTSNCNQIQLGNMWWRIPLYLACSASALAQYRFRVVEYWRGLAVQLVGYEVQYQVAQFFVERSASEKDNLDTMASNLIGMACAVIAACILSKLIDFFQNRYYGQLLQRDTHRYDTDSKIDDCVFALYTCKVKFFSAVKIGRREELDKIELERKLKQETDELRDPNHPREEVKLEEKEENLLLDTIVNAESVNIWAMLMPTVYQLVPGSIIAKLWFSVIFPPDLIETERLIEGTNYTYFTYTLDYANENIYANLMVVATSLALGLIVGFAFVQSVEYLATAFAWWESDEMKEDRKKELNMRKGMYTMAKDSSDDPEEKESKLSTVMEEKEDGGEEDDEEAEGDDFEEESPAQEESPVTST